MSRLKEIFEGLKFMTKDMPISPECILDNSVKIFISENIDRSKKENIQEYKKAPAKEPETQITEKQKNFLIKAKRYKQGISKQEAMQLIDQIVKERKSKESQY